VDVRVEGGLRLLDLTAMMVPVKLRVMTATVVVRFEVVDGRGRWPVVVRAREKKERSGEERMC